MVVVQCSEAGALIRVDAAGSVGDGDRSGTSSLTCFRRLHLSSGADLMLEAETEIWKIWRSSDLQFSCFLITEFPLEINRITVGKGGLS